MHLFWNLKIALLAFYLLIILLNFVSIYLFLEKDKFNFVYFFLLP